VTLYPHQETGRDWLAARKRAYLADIMGNGKSAQATTAAALIEPESTVIVCPASAVPNWHAEWEMWGGPGTPEIISYSTLARRKTRARPQLVILDEAHYVKSPSAKRTRAALRLAQSAEYAWLLSATPMPNNPTELYAPVKYLWPEVLEELGLRTADDWMHHFCKVRRTRYGYKPYAVRNGAQLRSILQRFMLRRTDRSNWPALRVDLYRLPKDVADLSAYESMQADERTYSSSLRRVLGVAKAPAVARQINEELDARAYRKIVVMYYHKDVGDVLRQSFENAGHTVVGFDGSTPQPQRWEAIQTFQKGDAQVFLAQQMSAGVAINLTAANEIVLVEPAWTPDDNSQAIARIRRIGQDRPCRARIFAIAGTIDMNVMATIRAKVRMQREVL